MSDEQPYNPLDRRSLADSVVEALLQRDAGPLPPADSFVGAGVYAIYYAGGFEPYRVIAEGRAGDADARPLYVGKAVPAGARKGGSGLNPNPGTVLFRRLNEHAQSIRDATNLALDDFWCRYLVVDDIWIPLGESLLIQRFSPVWNTVVAGFGNHDPGGGRRNQARSAWDVLHPGRPWAARLPAGTQSAQALVTALAEAGREA